MKQFSLATLSLLCATGMLSADAMGNKHAKASAQPTTTQPMNQITPSANPMVTHWADPYLTADFIWWRMQEDGLTFAYDGVSTTTGLDAAHGHIHQAKAKYEPGFKVGFGLKFKHDGWDFYGNYTWLRTDFEDTEKEIEARGSASPQVTNMFIHTTTGPVLAQVAGETKGEWSMHFNVLDLELGRNFWISQWLTLRPHFGMKFSWIDQDFNVKYDDVTVGNLTNANIKVHNDIDQWAVGLRTGLDAAYYLWKKWCIFGEFAISGIWNDFDVSRKDHTQTSATVSWNELHTKRDSHSVTGVLEFALGLRFETAFHNDDYLFMLQAGWEEQIWFNQNQFFFVTNQAPSDLTFEGLTVKAGFDF